MFLFLTTPPHDLFDAEASLLFRVGLFASSFLILLLRSSTIIKIFFIIRFCYNRDLKIHVDRSKELKRYSFYCIYIWSLFCLIFVTADCLQQSLVLNNDIFSDFFKYYSLNADFHTGTAVLFSIFPYYRS